MAPNHDEARRALSSLHNRQLARAARAANN
jgi:hypothetical protein